MQVEKQIGERRLISYHGVGLSVAPEMSFSEIASDIENHEEVCPIHNIQIGILFLIRLIIHGVSVCHYTCNLSPRTLVSIVIWP